ncbi:hypothetical protein JCM18237_18600 [Halorubrum luteum]
MLCGVVAVARAASGPEARERAREGDRRGAAERCRRPPPVEAGAVRGCGAVGWDWKGQPRGRRTATKALQGAKRPKRAASRASRRGWGFRGSLLSTAHLYTALLHIE